MEPFYIPTKIYYGENCIKHLSKFKNPFIVCDSFFAKHPIAENLVSQNETTTLFTNFTPDPSLDSVALGIAEFSKKNHQSIIAIGGGSAIDTAKGIIYFSSEASIPFAVIPTTSGSGSEVTSFAVITDKKTNIKHPIVSDKMLPCSAFLEPQVVKSMPKSLAADTGADVLSHALESYVSLSSSHFSSPLAENAIISVFKFLKKSVDGNYEARKEMHLASCLAGIAFNHSNLGLCHAIAHNMGARLNIPHGRANAILLPHIVCFNSGLKRFSDELSDAGLKYAHISKLIGNEGSPQVLVKKLIKDIKELFSSISLPVSINIDENTMEEIAKCALEDGCIKTNPILPTKEQIVNILKEVR